MTKLILTATKNASLGHVVDYIRKSKPNMPERASTFILDPGIVTEIGSGDVEIIKITIEFKNPDQDDLQDIEDIIDIVDRGDGEIKIERS